MVGHRGALPGSDKNDCNVVPWSNHRLEAWHTKAPGANAFWVIKVRPPPDWHATIERPHLSSSVAVSFWLRLSSAAAGIARFRPSYQADPCWHSCASRNCCSPSGTFKRKNGAGPELPPVATDVAFAFFIWSISSASKRLFPKAIPCCMLWIVHFLV